MRAVSTMTLVGAALSMASGVVAAQRPGAPPSAPRGIGQTTIQTPPPRGNDGRWNGGDGHAEWRRNDGWRGRYATPRWILPATVEPQPYYEAPSSPPVISGVTAIIDRRTPEPRPAPVPYDPRKAALTVIGGGADGGGGVMKLERPSPDALRITWLGAQRPVAEARVIVTDEAQGILRAQTVSLGARVADFSLAGIRDRAAYVGVAVVHTDGSRRTVLVPLR